MRCVVVTPCGINSSAEPRRLPRAERANQRSGAVHDPQQCCAGVGSPGDGEKPRGCWTAGSQGVKSNQKENHEVKPPEKDFFSNQR